MDFKAEAIRLARQEICNPIHNVSKDFLKVHKLKFENGEPIANNVVVSSDADHAIVYFPIEGEDYFCAIPVFIENGELKTGWIEAEARVELYFTIFSEDIAPEEITEMLELIPSKVRKKGEKIGRTSRVRKDYEWIYELDNELAGDVDDKLSNLLNALSSHMDKIVELTERGAEMGINIAYLGYKDQMWGLHFDCETINTLEKLKVWIDIDLYAAGPDYPYNDE